MATHTFLIADVAFELACEQRLRIPGGLGAYDEFDGFVGGRPKGGSTIPVRVLSTEFHRPTEWRQAFDADSWQAYRAGDQVFLTTVNPADPARPTVLSGLPDGTSLVVHQTCVPGCTSEARAGSVISPMRHPLDKALLMHLLPRFSGFMIHAAGIVKGGRGLVCSGVSGAGKSTLSALADRGGWRVLTDERPIVRGDGPVHRVYGTPWPGDGGFARNESAPLKAVVFLRQSPVNRAVPVKALAAIQRLMPVISMPMYDPDFVTAYADALDRLISRVPCYELEFTPDERVLPVLDSLLDG